MNSSDDITLAVGNIYLAQLIFDPYYAMQPISIESLEAAEVSYEYNTPFIEISSDENTTLYENVLFRLEKSIKMLVQ